MDSLRSIVFARFGAHLATIGSRFRRRFPPLAVFDHRSAPILRLQAAAPTLDRLSGWQVMMLLRSAIRLALDIRDSPIPSLIPGLSAKGNTGVAKLCGAPTDHCTGIARRMHWHDRRPHSTIRTRPLLPGPVPSMMVLMTLTSHGVIALVVIYKQSAPSRRISSARRLGIGFSMLLMSALWAGVLSIAPSRESLTVGRRSSRSQAGISTARRRSGVCMIVSSTSGVH